MRPAKFQIVSALVLSGLFAMASAQTIEPSGISFKVADSPGFPVLDTGAGSILEYDLSGDRIDFKLGATGSYDNPFFCFDFSSPDSAAVTLNATDANGHAVMDSVGLASELSYNLADTISFSPSSSVKCFYESTETDSATNETTEVFGLFGDATASRGSGEDGVPLCSDLQEGSTEDCRFFKDDFAVYPDLAITFSDVRINDQEALEGIDFSDASASSGDSVTYNLVIRNTGKGDAESVALQEVFPASADGETSPYHAALTEGDWMCIDVMETGACPVLTGSGPIRFTELPLPAGSEVIFEITRKVMNGSEGQINLYAGIINGGSGQSENAATKAELAIAGEPTALNFSIDAQNTTSGETMEPVEVEVLDGNDNVATGDSSTVVTIQLWRDGTGYIDNLDGASVTNGTVTFSELLISANPGTGYYLLADPSSSGIQSAESSRFEVL